MYNKNIGPLPPPEFRESYAPNKIICEISTTGRDKTRSRLIS